MNPLFSVVISLYNKEQFIADTLQSVLNQSFADFEVIVINDGSTDESLKIVEEFTDERIHIFSQENYGASVARNNGIKHSSGTYIALLDGDDLWHTDYLKTIAATIHDHPDESIYATAIAHKVKQKIVPAHYNNLPSGHTNVLNFFEYSLKTSLLSGSSTVFKKDILEETGWFDPEIKSGQDTDLWIRFGLKYSVVFINKILVSYVYSDKSLSNTTFNMNSKPKFLKYRNEEKEHPALKKLLDRNRYAMAISSKIHKQNEAYQFYKNSIDVKNLSPLKRLLLRSPKWLLLSLLNLKSLRKEKLYYKPL